MPGIYYYLWNKYTLDDPDEINLDLEDMRALGFDFILVDLHESFLEPCDEWHKRYLAGVHRLIEESPNQGLRILPICAFGAGLFARQWWDQNPQSALQTRGGSIYICPDHGIPATSYDENSIRRFVAHQRRIAELTGDCLYRCKGAGVMNVLSDAGYHHIDKDLTFPGDSAAERKKRVNRCLHAMKQEAASHGYQALVKAFRSMQPFHADREIMGIDYDAMACEIDGFIDGVVHIPTAPGRTWSDQIRSGFAIASKSEMMFPVVLCERAHFSPEEQFTAIVEHTQPTDVVFYPYNEYIGSDVCLREYQPHRKTVRRLCGQLAALMPWKS